MLNDLLVIERPSGAVAGGSNFFGAHLSGPWFNWQTCLRQVAFGHKGLCCPPQNIEGCRVYSGVEAFRHVLQVICGLQSPILGETEVLGQFKQFMEKLVKQIKTDPESETWEKTFLNAAEVWVGQAKKVREAHLLKLGGQSYGSWLRQNLGDYHSIQIIGAGHLAQEILPWLNHAQNSVEVLCRRPELAKLQIQEQFKKPFKAKLTISQWADKKMGQASVVVVAAPLSTPEIDIWIKQQSHVRWVIDLRSDSAQQQQAWTGLSGVRLTTLNEVFESIQSQQKKLEQKKQLALAMIENILKERQSDLKNRPFGWDDLCA